MKKYVVTLASIAILTFVAIGCDRSVNPSGETDPSISQEIKELESAARQIVTPIVPSPLLTVDFNAEAVTIWPYTGNDFTGEGHDPINLIFVGKADPRNIRAALLSLDGDRSDYGMPPVPPFNSRWDDAVGDIQTGYGGSEGWTAGCIQLECGDHLQTRFHLRLFNIGEWTVANCHFELLIPGTSEHQVLSWEVAEQLVMVDFLRSGLLDPDMPMYTTDEINTAPGWRTIPTYVYNELPVELRQLIGGPLGDVVTEVPIGTNGCATILNLAGEVDWVPEVRTQDFYINFGQVVPKPFCGSGPSDYVYVEGPVHLYQTTELTENGKYLTNFNAVGELSVTPVNPLTGEPVAETMRAHVLETHRSQYSDYRYSAASMQYQKLLPNSDENAGRLFTCLKADSRDRYFYYANIRCNSSIDELAAKPAVDLLSVPIEE